MINHNNPSNSKSDNDYINGIESKKSNRVKFGVGAVALLVAAGSLFGSYMAHKIDEEKDIQNNTVEGGQTVVMEGETISTIAEGIANHWNQNKAEGCDDISGDNLEYSITLLNGGGSMDYVQAGQLIGLPNLERLAHCDK